MIDNSTIMEGHSRRQRRYIIITGILLILVVVIACFMMIYGNTIYTPKEIIRILKSDEMKGAAFTIKTLRMPRMLAAVLTGVAFGVAGNTFQKLFGNPLASPDVIGVTSGASVAAVFGILVLRLNGDIISWMAVISGLAVSGIIYMLSRGEKFSNGRIILTGIGMQAFLNSLISWMLLKAAEYDVSSALRWLSGSLNGVTMNQIPRLAIAVCFSVGLIIALNRHLQILQLGDSHATVLGVRKGAVRVGLMLCSLLLIAFATSVTGPIASVAFLSGPIASGIVGHGRNNTIASALTGAILVMSSDIVGQYALPSRYPVGVVTGILGAPYLIYLLIRINRRSE